MIVYNIVNIQKGIHDNITCTAIFKHRNSKYSKIKNIFSVIVSNFWNFRKIYYNSILITN